MARRRSLRAIRPLLAAVSLSAAARAEGSDEVLLAGTGVPENVSVDAVMQILAAELSPTGVEALTPANVGRDATVLGIDDCTTTPPSARISIWRNGQRRERILTLADAAKGTERRTLAIG